jgi:hypothetical protein
MVSPATLRAVIRAPLAKIVGNFPVDAYEKKRKKTFEKCVSLSDAAVGLNIPSALITTHPYLTFAPLVIVPLAFLQFGSFVALDVAPIRWLIIKESIATIDRFILIGEAIEKALVVAILSLHVINRPFQGQKQSARDQQTQDFGRIPSLRPFGKRGRRWHRGMS